MIGLCSAQTQRFIQEMPTGNNSNSKALWNRHIVKIACFGLLAISFNIDTTHAYYIPNDWKLYQISAELYGSKLPCLEAGIC